MILVVASIVWWWVNPSPSIHVFKGEIKGLRDYEKITSSSLYFKPVLLKKLEEEAPQIRDEHFMISQEKAFAESDDFEILYSKGEGKVEPCCFRYTSHVKPKFRIEWDRKLGKTVLRNVSTPLETGLAFVNEAYAESTGSPSNTGRIAEAVSKPPSSGDLPNRQIIELLQNERTDVGTKIGILDKLNRLNDENLKKYIEVSINKEPVVLTLLDLTRHTDEELAYKANKIINERFDVCSFLSQRLLSTDQRKHEESVEILYRIEPERAEKALSRLPTSVQGSWLYKLRADMQSGDKSRVLIPTGSAGGDRYYVKAEWDPQNEQTVSRLTRLFNSSLISNRTLKEEALLMQARSKRWVYWYSKEWALSIARNIEECGGKASFVNGFSFK